MFTMDGGEKRRILVDDPVRSGLLPLLRG